MTIEKLCLVLAPLVLTGCAFGATGAVMASVDTQGRVGVEVEGSGVLGAVLTEAPSTVVPSILPSVLAGVGYKGKGFSSREAMGGYVLVAGMLPAAYIPADGTSWRVGVALGGVIPFRHDYKAGFLLRGHAAAYPERRVRSSRTHYRDDDGEERICPNPKRRTHDLGAQLALGLWWTDDRTHAVTGEALVGPAYQYLSTIPWCGQ